MLLGGKQALLVLLMTIYRLIRDEDACASEVMYIDNLDKVDEHVIRLTRQIRRRQVDEMDDLAEPS